MFDVRGLMFEVRGLMFEVRVKPTSNLKLQTSNIRLVLHFHQEVNVLINRQDQQAGSCTKHRAGDAMMTLPTTIIVLDLYHATCHFFEPVCPSIVFAND